MNSIKQDFKLLEGHFICNYIDVRHSLRHSCMGRLAASAISPLLYNEDISNGFMTYFCVFMGGWGVYNFK